MNLYAVAVSASKPGGSTQMMAGVVPARDDEEAANEGLRMGHEQWPVADGWCCYEVIHCKVPKALLEAARCQ